MKIDEKLISKLENLSMVEIEDKAKMAKELEDIVGFVDMLNELDTKNIDSSFSTLDISTPLRDDTPDKKDIIKSIIKSKLGVTETVLQGRKTVFRKITSKQARDFLNKNHRQGGGGVTNESYALLSDGEIVAVMSFKSERFTSKNRTELYRYASKLDTTINGGFSKLLKNALKEINGDIVSYADLRFTSKANNIYEKNGFKLEHLSKPCQWYYKENTTKNLVHRMNMQKHKLKKKLDFFNESMSGEDNIRANGYIKIWDCGTAVYVLNRT